VDRGKGRGGTSLLPTVDMNLSHVVQIQACGHLPKTLSESATWLRVTVAVTRRAQPIPSTTTRARMPVSPLASAQSHRHAHGPATLVSR
jgi:hypothetical protein